MNVLLQKHGAKHIYKVPEGLRELCTDIAREVLRSQPKNIYCFIADYVEALLITRENTKVAVKVVNNILSESQTVVDILHRSGLSLQQIARAAPRIQTAFRAYLDSVDMRAAQVYDDATCDERSKVSLESILRASGVSLEQAEKYATIIQAAFRGHYERMLLNESRGMIQWQRAATRTLEILRKAGASRAEASKAAILIQATYRGYYTRKNLKMKMAAALPPEKETSEADMIEPKEITQAVAWLDTTYGYKDLKLMPITANKAASIIEKAYRQYRLKKSGVIPWIKLERSMAEEERSMAVLKNLHQKVFNEVITRADIPVEFGSREDLTKAGTSTEELQHTSRDRLTRARMMKEDEYDEEALARIEKPDELLEKLIDESMYTIDMLENWKKDRENKKDLERDEKTKHT